MKFMIFMTTLIGLSVQAAELKPFAAYKGVMESFERKIGEFNTEALYGLNKAQKLSAIPVSGDTITVTPGETIALAFKNKDVKTPLHRGKVVYRLEGSSANFEFKDGSRPTIIEFEKDINVPEARK
ncbi:MAG: hypothetical protein KBD63_07730, partial [Bacteriovoracaceae bacterium]|nr:hypothetical protein [Bacteriovoracaceae bacterium]